MKVYLDTWSEGSAYINHLNVEQDFTPNYILYKSLLSVGLNRIRCPPMINPLICIRIGEDESTRTIY